MRFVICVATLIAAAPASAAPFCTVSAFGKNCWYFTYDSCLMAAGPTGACVVNQDEVHVQPGGAPFCVVSAIGANCWYYDVNSCRTAARVINGVCAVR